MMATGRVSWSGPFPDLKGQAPLRLGAQRDLCAGEYLLFLTSKVRLHCDYRGPGLSHAAGDPFPDLKGQAPLRPEQLLEQARQEITFS